MRWISALLLLSFVPLLFAQDKRDKKKELFEPLPPIVPAELQRTEPVEFLRDIKPILENKCEYCHSGAVKEGRYDMTSHEALLKGGKSGAAIVPGKPDESFLYKLTSRTGVPAMPPKDEEPLTPTELALLRRWIAEGAKDSPAGVAARMKTLDLRPMPASVKSITALALSADEKQLAVGQGGRILLYDLAEDKPPRILIDPELKDAAGQPLGLAQLDAVQALAFAPDGKRLAAGSFQEVVWWDTAAGTPSARTTGFQDRILALEFSPDGKLLAAAGGPPAAEAELKLLDAATAAVVAEVAAPHSDQIYAVRFSPDGQLLATAGADRFVRVFAVPSGTLQKSFEGHTHQVIDVGWKADGKLLVSGGADAVLKVWDYALGEQVRTIRAHGKEVTSLRVLRGQPWIASAGADAQAKFWNVDNGQGIRTLGGAANVLHALCVSADGKLVVTAGAEGIVRLYDGHTGKLTKTLPTPQ